MRNFESYSPVILEPIKPKTTADFLGKEGPQQDIFEASKNLDLEKPINFDFNKEKEIAAQLDISKLAEARASLGLEQSDGKDDLRKYFKEYLELKEGDAEKIELIKAKELPRDYQEQLESFNDQRLGSITIAVIPDNLWVKGSQPSESDAEKGLISIKQSYFEKSEKPDEIAWLTHEFAHCQNLLDSKTASDYEKSMQTQAFADLKLEGTYPNNIVEQQTFTKQFKFLQEQGKNREDIIKMISLYYDKEDMPFFDKLLDNVYEK